MISSAQEELLAVSAAKGDKKACRSLIVTHQDWIYALAFRISQNRDIAAKASIYALAEAVKGLKPLPEGGSFAESAARNLIDYFRKHFKDGFPETELTFEQQLNLKDSLPRERKALLGMMVAGLKRLSMEERILLLLRDQVHFPCDAIADMTGRPRPLVRQRLSSVRGKLRKAMTRPLENNPTLSDETPSSGDPGNEFHDL